MNSAIPSNATNWTGAADKPAAEADVIARIAREGVIRHTALELKPDPQAATAPQLVWPDKTVQSLEHLLPSPLRKRGGAQLRDPDSFAAYVVRYKTASTVLVGDFTLRCASFSAFLDYHDAELDGGRARWSEHQATLDMKPTVEWARWTDISGKDLNQQTFAEFLEDNAPDITSPENENDNRWPTMQELLSVASTLQVKTDVKFASSVKLQNGQVQLGYVETIEGGHGIEGKFSIPEKFALAIAPFDGTPKYLVTARLRYRGVGGKAVFKVEIERPHKTVEHAFNEVRNRLEQLIGIRPMVGAVVPQPLKAP